MRSPDLSVEEHHHSEENIPKEYELVEWQRLPTSFYYEYQKILMISDTINSVNLVDLK